jgi:hypothetical protein
MGTEKQGQKNGWALPTMSGELCIAIRLGRQNTAAKSLVKPDINNCFKIRARSAHKTAFHFPCAPPSSADWSGGVGEDCLSTWPRSGSCEFRSRLTSRATQGTPQGRQTGAAFSLVSFFWPLKRKRLVAGLPPAVFALSHYFFLPNTSHPQTEAISKKVISML